MILSRKTAEELALGGNKTFSLFTTALLLCGTAAITEAGILILLGDKLTFLFSDEAAHPVFLIMIPALVSTAVYCVVRGWLWGSKNFVAFSATETVEEALRILFSVFLLSGVFGSLSGVDAIAWAFTITDILVAILLFVLFFAKGGKIEKPSDLRKILLPSLPITAMRISASLIGTLIAFLLPLRLITFGMSGAEATASYGRIAGMANPLLNAPNAAIGSLCIVLIPELSASRVKNDYDRLNKHISLGIRFSFLVSGLFIVLYSSLGKEITTLLYSDSISGEYMQVATFCMLPTCLSQLTQSALNSIGKEYNAFVNYLVGNLFMLSVIYILPKLIGIYSVAAATFLCTLVISVLNLVSLHKATKIGSDFLKYALLVLLFTIPCHFLCEWTCSLLTPFLDKFAFLPAAFIGLCAYAALCVIANVLDIRGILLSRFRSLPRKKTKKSAA